MTSSPIPGSVGADDNLRIWFVPDTEDFAKNPLSVLVLQEATTKDITYSLTPAGYNHAITEESVPDERMSLKQVLQNAGRVNDELEVQYVYGATDDIAKVALAQGTYGWIVARWAVANATDPTTGQEVDAIPIRCGVQRKDAPAANANLTRTQKMFVRGAVKRDELLVA